MDKLRVSEQQHVPSSYNAARVPLGGAMERVKWLLCWPILLLLYLTVPDCAKPRWERCYLLSFFLSTVWIAIFSYFMVWMVSGWCWWREGGSVGGLSLRVLCLVLCVCVCVCVCAGDYHRLHSGYS